jgi:hypothetical protein
VLGGAGAEGTAAVYAPGVKAANDGLRFLLELAALASLAYWGWKEGSGATRWLLAIGAPLVVAVLWATLVTTNSSSKLDDPWRLLLEIAIFGSAAAALVGVGRVSWGIVLAAVAAIHLALTFVLDQR